MPRAALDRAVEAAEAAEAHPDVLWGGFVQDAAKEYAEARITAAVVRGEPWPTVEDVDVPDGLTRGLRRATDVSRSITERTRGT